MKLYIFGSCSGTEPISGRHHTAFALEINGRVYWFDAGENCSYTAHLMGVDLLSVADIFISHPHMDHVGGLGNLLWNIRKLSKVQKQLPRFGDVTVYISDLQTFDGVMSILKHSEDNYATAYQTLAAKITDGVLLKNENIEVTAAHNHHLPEAEDGWRSFSFRISAQGKTIIYSGDVKSIEDIAQFLSEGCDVLLMETGHHRAEEVCQTLLDKKYRVGSVYFLHHGRNILKDFEGSLRRCRSIFPNVKFCNDKDIFDL